MRLKVLLIVAVLAATLSAPALAQVQPRDEIQQSGSTIVLFAGDPFTTGNVVAFSNVNQAVAADMSNVTFVDVRICNRGHVFAVERLAASGELMAGTIVRVRGGTMTLAEVVARIEHACAIGNIGAVAASLGANATLSTSALANLRGHAIFMASTEGGARRIVSVNRLDDSISADLAARGVTHVRLQMGSTGHVFAVSRLPAAGRPIGETLVTVNGQAMTLADVSGRLEAAQHGDRALIFFTTGPSSDAVVVGVAEPGRVDLEGRVNFTGATHAHVILNGQERVFVITNPSMTTFGSIMVRPEGDSAAVEGRLFIEVLPMLEIQGSL